MDNRLPESEIDVIIRRMDDQFQPSHTEASRLTSSWGESWPHLETGWLETEAERASITFSKMVRHWGDQQIVITSSGFSADRKGEASDTDGVSIGTGDTEAPELSWLGYLVGTPSLVARSDLRSTIKRKMLASARHHAPLVVDSLSGENILKRLEEAYSEQYDPADNRVKLDADYVAQRLNMIFPVRQSQIWLESHNQLLRARPLDALILRNMTDLVAALDAEEQGLFS